MPVCYLVDNTLDLLAARFSRTVTKDQVLAAISGAAGEMSPDKSYKSLAIFEHDVDLSQIDVAALAQIRSAQHRLFRASATDRGPAAAVIDHSTDARLVMPLHNALCEIDSSSELGFTLFESVEAALDYLDLPRQVGETLLARTKP